MDINKKELTDVFRDFIGWNELGGTSVRNRTVWIVFNELNDNIMVFLNNEDNPDSEHCPCIAVVKQNDGIIEIINAIRAQGHNVL